MLEIHTLTVQYTTQCVQNTAEYRISVLTYDFFSSTSVHHKNSSRSGVGGVQLVRHARGGVRGGLKGVADQEFEVIVIIHCETDSYIMYFNITSKSMLSSDQRKEVIQCGAMRYFSFLF